MTRWKKLKWAQHVWGSKDVPFLHSLSLMSRVENNLGYKWKSYSTESTCGQESVSCQELRVSISKYGSHGEEGADLMFTSLRERNCNGIHKKSERVMWCQSAGIVDKRDLQRQPEGKTVISMVWFCKHNWCVVGRGVPSVHQCGVGLLNNSGTIA